MTLAEALNAFEKRANYSPTMRELLSWPEYAALKQAMIEQAEELRTVRFELKVIV